MPSIDENVPMKKTCSSEHKANRVRIHMKNSQLCI